MPNSRRGISSIALTLFLAFQPALCAQEPPPADRMKTLEDELRRLRGDYESRVRGLEEEIRTVRAQEKADAREELRRKAAQFLKKKEGEGAISDLAGQLGGASPSVSNRLNEFNPRMTVFGDFLGRIDSSRVTNEDGVDITDRFSLREAEVDLRADIDPYAKGVLILAAEEENPNEYEFTIEEGYMDLHTIPGLEETPHNVSTRIGRFRTEFGLVNVIHTHDLPWTSRPLPLVRFLGEEGDIENGIGLEYLVHNPWDEAITIGYQAVNGENEELFGGAGSNDIAHLLRAKWHKQISDEHEIHLGHSSYLGNAETITLDDETRFAALFGWDFYYRWRPIEGRDQTSFLFQTEFYHRNREEEVPPLAEGGAPHFDSLNAFGFYTAVQYQFLKNFYLGSRFDYVSGTETTSAGDFEHKTGVYVSYYTSEFLRFRLGWEHEERQSDAFNNDTLLFGVTWVFGSHPVEPYWVNR